MSICHSACPAAKGRIEGSQARNPTSVQVTNALSFVDLGLFDS